jgi:dTDP-4-dehydrorhamnose reductase
LKPPRQKRFSEPHMNVIVVGGLGQLGRALTAALAAHGHTSTVWDMPEVNITQPAVADAVVAAKPDTVINTAAWTNVDAAEANPQATYAVNALGPRWLAEGCERAGAQLLHVSTNEVFAGTPGRIYYEHDQPQPGGTYARSKAAGEAAAAAACRRLIIARIAWLFGPGGVNFPTKIAEAADKHGALRVINDEFGNPTYAPDAADAMVRLLELGRTGIFHLVNEGVASRMELAQAVLAGSGRSYIPVTPIAAAEWQRAAPPPLHAVLANQAAAALGITLRPWQDALHEYAATLAAPAGAQSATLYNEVS